MHRVRIVLVGLRRMTAELVKEVYDQYPETVVERVFSRRLPLAAVAAEHRPDLLITAVPAETFPEIDAVLDAYPRLTLLVVDADERTSFLYRLRPQTECLGGLAADTLLAAARAAAPALT